MRVRQMMSLVVDSVSRRRVYWMKDESGEKVSVCASLSERAKAAEDDEFSKRLAARAEGLAREEARKLGADGKTGVLMGGDGKGNVTAIGIAEIPWTPQVEQKLNGLGVFQIQ